MVREAEGVTEVDRARVECTGLDLSRPMAGSLLHCLRVEFGLWASFANLEAKAQHQYWKNATTGAWQVRSHRCLRELDVHDQQDAICTECLKLTKSKSIVKAPIRFAKKFFAAELLHARLFEGEEKREAVINELRNSSLYQREQKSLEGLLVAAVCQDPGYVSEGVVNNFL